MEFREITNLVDDSYTLSYAFDLEKWVGFHDYVGNHYFNTRNQNAYSFFNKAIWKHNVGNYGNFYNGVYPSSLQLVINPQYPDTQQRLRAFILENITINCDFYSSARLLDKLFNTVQIYNSYQNTQPIQLIHYDTAKRLADQWRSWNVYRKFNMWNINKFGVRLKDTFAVVKLEYNNTSNYKMSFSHLDFDSQLL